MKKIIGLTGSIATGKSTVAKLFLENGIYVIDSDKIANEVSKDPEIIAAVRNVFGPESIGKDGQFNREYIGNVVFCSKEKRMKLNNIMHPKVKEEIKKLVELRKNKIVVVDVPLMYETDFHEMMDEIIVVYSTPEQQVERLMERNHYNYEDAMLRVNSQMHIDEKAKRADYLLDNTGTKMDLYQNFKTMLNELKL